MPERVLIYCRQSLTKDDDSLSLAFQERACREVARQRGWTVAEPPILDPDVKGYDPARPGITELFRRIEPERIEIVAVYAMSRFARDNILQETLWRNLHAKGVRLVSATEPHAEDDLVRGILGVVSQAERKRMGRFLSSSFQERAHRGLPHGRTPFGYAKNAEGRLETVEDSADIVRWMADRLEEGASLWQVARELNATNAGDRRWEPNVVRNTVTTYAVTGAIKCGETIVWDTHEPIIERDRWERLRVYLADRRPTRTKPLSSWLEGLIDCGCGAPLHLVTQMDRGTMRGQFRCAASPSLEQFQRPRALPACTHTPRSISMAKAERAVSGALAEALGQLVPADVVYARQRARYEELTASSGKEIAKLKRQADRLAVERDRLLAIYRRGSLDVERWESEDRALGERIAVVDRELSAYGAAPQPEPFVTRHTLLVSLRDALLTGPQQARAVLLQLDARVQLRSMGIVRIVWPDHIAPFFDAVA